MSFEPSDALRTVAERARDADGRALLVGGAVRDHLLGRDQRLKDDDVEIYGLSLDTVRGLLPGLGPVLEVGRAFGVLRLPEAGMDVSLPRRDSKIGRGHRGFDVDADPHLSYAEAAERRDLTINAIGLDPLTGEIVDPLHGRADLEAGVLRAASPEHFAEDPLRGLRVARFAATLEMQPDDALVRLCGELDLSELSPERIGAELDRLLLDAMRPSLGFELLARTGLRRFFPEIEALSGTPQDPEWHPEGDVFVHTLMVLDEAAKLRGDDEWNRPLMYGALCHDFGKPSTTEHFEGRIRSHKHDTLGVPIAESFLERLRLPHELARQVGALVRYHLAPGVYFKNGATPKAYRRLARELEAAGATMELLLRVATADHLGRTTPDALAGEFPAGEHFQRQMQELAIGRAAPRDAVLGRHLIARGMKPGKHFGDILSRCRELQDEHGWDDPERILEVALEEGDPE